MDILSVLRKLGILRFGSKKAKFHDAKERPLEIQQEGVFNAEKDTIYNDEKKVKK